MFDSFIMMPEMIKHTRNIKAFLKVKSGYYLLEKHADIVYPPESPMGQS